MRKFVIEKLQHPEHSGDWHDKPLKWVALCAADSAFTQKFSTRKDAELWARIANRHADFNGACAAWATATL